MIIRIFCSFSVPSVWVHNPRSVLYVGILTTCRSLELDKRWSTPFLKSLSIMSSSCSLLRCQSGFKHLVGLHVPTIQHLWLLARSFVRTTKILNLPFSFRKDQESHVAMLVARSLSLPPPPPLGVSVAKHRPPVLQTCGLGRASSDASKNSRFEVQTCSWKTVIGASCPPAPQSYRCHVILQSHGVLQIKLSHISGTVFSS